VLPTLRDGGGRPDPESVMREKKRTTPSRRGILT
jgi:hypothetical protein